MDPVTDATFLDQLREALSYEPLQWWHIWVILGIAACILEMLTPGFVLLCLGIGAFAAAITDAIGLNDLKVQVSVLAAATLISFFLLRPVLKRWLLSKGDDTNVDALAGREGSVTKQIEAGGFGDVRVGSEIWRAETADGSALEKGSRVRVAQVEGNRVIVEKIS